MDIDQYKNEVSSVAAKATEQFNRILDQGQLDVAELYKVSNGLCSLARGVSEINRGARTRAMLLAKVRAEFSELLRQHLAARPDLVSEMRELMDSASYKLLDTYGEDTTDLTNDKEMK